ncbi:hypothetical protein FDENT_5197 [Fusarium denticulatum]|uniref:Uncharacterized protein n=1 Tax=Fusarium denticulatum TaxID=48507 RepID=A0A8H5UKQ0_9HYPO|nr:hypothetical protein FDENT_5197 [Fusarium denticulatum]
MSQPHPQSQEAAAEIIRAVNVGGPDKFWPELVPELNIFVGFGYNGHWDLQFESPVGAKVTNVMTPSEVCPGAMVYYGTKEGIRKAFLTVINVSQRLEIISRTANLRLRVADTHEYAQPRDDSPTYPFESSGQLAVFLLPSRKEPESAACG